MPDPIQSVAIRSVPVPGRVAVSAAPANLNYCWLCRQAGRQAGRLAAHVCIHMYLYALKQIYSRPDSYMVPAQVAKVDNLMWLSC